MLENELYKLGTTSQNHVDVYWQHFNWIKQKVMAQVPRHINHTRMHQLWANSMVVDLCNTCLKGKQHHNFFPKESGTNNH
jgi:hypothetical protein